ncbi:sugar O-acetyltransferase [Massilia cavernae]|uniref:Sugar O-acetyltransferase n=1 Tax=Massilia cavernae TaxID=2320864 RepID=A0A418X7Q0_9BURK|nr:sugar O-acetyltransferase [Massilia cavernae]RJG08509.1 sugar O-acetyltransferase [Massilia cavernae]
MNKTEQQKMVAGELYDPADPELAAARQRARELTTLLNNSPEGAPSQRTRIIGELLGKPSNAVIQPPFYCDYGANINMGQNVYFNFNCVVLDVAPVNIGDHVLFGPAVQVYTATHPLNAAERRKGLESGKPIVIHDDVWIGGGAVICPGVTIGAGSVIGSGSVVTKDIPAGVFAAGNPCKVIKPISD